MPTPTDFDDLLRMSESELEELFRESPAGEIRDGDADGRVLVAPGRDVTFVAAKILRLVAWQGKVFDRSKSELKNKVGPTGLRAVRAKVYKEPSWFDGKETIVLDYSKTSRVASRIRDEIREVSPGLYLGLVFWGRKKVALFALKFGV